MLGRILRDLIVRAPVPASAPVGADAAGVLPLDEVNCLVRGRHGWFLANRQDQYLGRALIRYGEYGENEQVFLNALLAPGDDVIEVGANIGSHTVGLAKAIGPEGTLIAIEAQPWIFRVLCANLALNALPNVRPHACGCGDRRTTMIAPAIDYNRAGPHNSGGVSLAATGDGIPVPVLPLDELAGNVARLRLIKIDVEGMELEVLRGAARLIARHRPLLYVENDRMEKSKALIEHILSLGYRLWWHAPYLFNPANYFGVAENDYPDIVSLNMICRPQETTTPLPPGFALKEITDPDYHPWRERA